MLHPQASAVRVKVGFPLSPNTSSASAIADYYAPVNVDKADFFGNMLKVRSLIFPFLLLR